MKILEHFDFKIPAQLREMDAEKRRMANDAETRQRLQKEEEAARQEINFSKEQQRVDEAKPKSPDYGMDEWDFS